MIQINPLQSYIDGGARAAITTPPSASLVFDLPGKAIWVKGVKLKGTDHAYTFSHDNYISITNTPDQNNPESEDIKIGINTTLLKLAIDTTYGIVNATTNGLAPMFSNANKASATAATTYNFLGIAGSTLKWYQLPWRNVRINAETSDVLGINNTDPLIISSGNGIEVSWDSTNKKIVITNTKPDINHNTDTHVSQLAASDNADRPVILKQSATTKNEVGSVRYTSTLLYNPSTKILKINGNRVVTFANTYVGATSSANATTGLVPVASSANRNKFLRGDGTWLTPSDYNTWRPVKVGTTDALGSGTNTGALVLAAGTGISLSWDSTNKQVIITNSSPDVNHNTDKTGVKLGTVSGTKKTDGTVIITNSSAGLTFQGGTNLIKIGDGTNYIEVPITISHGLSTKNMTINGTAYALYTSASSLPTIIAPSSFGTANYILATNSSGNGFAWVAKPTSNVTTTAIVGNSATATSQITAAQTNPYYNLLEGGAVTRSIRFVAGNGITISAATDGLITITNSKPDVNHNTHYVTTMYIGKSNDTKSNVVATNPYLKLFDNDTRRSTLRFVAGTGITIASDANGNITVTNSAPDLNHNTDRTGLKKGTAGSTVASGLVIANSASGLIMEGGTHKFKVGDGTNSFEIPITVTNLSLTAISALSSFIHASDLIYAAKGGGNTVTDKPSGVDAFGVISMKTADGWYGQLLMSSNTASGIYWRTASSTLSGGWKLIADSGNVVNNNISVAWNTETTIATIAGVPIKIKIPANPNSNTWRNVRINAETSDRLGKGTNTGPLIIKSGTGISVTWDTTNKAVVITNSAPDVNHDTHYTTHLYIGKASKASNEAIGNPYLKLYDNSTLRHQYQLKGDGASIKVDSDSSGNLTTKLGVIYCRGGSSPSNSGVWNTIKNGTSSPVTDSVRFYTIYNDGGPTTHGEMLEILSYNSNHWQPQLWFGAGRGGHMYYRNKDYNNNTWGSWLTIADSGNISNKNATIGTSSTTIATIAGVNITAKIGSYAASNHTHSLSIAADSGTSSIALAASTKYKLTAGGSTYVFTSTPDLNVKLVDNNNNENVPILLKNGTGTGTITSSVRTVDGVTVNPSNNSLTLAGYIGLDNDPAAFRILVGADTAGSPLRGITTPTVGGRWVGIFARPGKSTDEGGFLLSQEGSAIYNSFDSGFGFKVVDTDTNKSNWNDAASVVFSVLSDNRAYSKGGFYKNGSSDSYILLGGGGHKLLTDLLTAASLGTSGNNTTLSVTVGGTTKTGSVTVPYATNSSTLGGTSKSGLLTAFSLGASGDSTTGSITVGGTTLNSSVTVPYATSASRLKYKPYSNNLNDPGTLLAGGGITRNYGSSSYWQNCPSGLSYGACVEFYAGDESLSGQFIWDINHNQATSTRNLYFRASNNLGWLNDWKRIAWASEIPTVNNASLTLQTAGTTLTTFYANDSTNRTFNVTCANIGAAPEHSHPYLPIAYVSENQTDDWGKDYAKTHYNSYVYNSSGREWSYWIGMKPDLAYGNILRLSHDGLVLYCHKTGGDKDSNWSAWKDIITSDNIGSLSVNYATSAGNADTVDGYHASSFLQRKDIHSDQDDPDNLRYNFGLFDKCDYNGTYASEYPACYGEYISLAYSDNNTAVLLFFDCPCCGKQSGPKPIYVRTRGAGETYEYSPWGALAYLTDNVASATKLQTARLFTIGNTGKYFDGTTDVSWTLAEIGVQPDKYLWSELVSLPLDSTYGTGPIDWAVSYAASHPRSFVYNTYGAEYSYLNGMNGTSYGTILKMGYTDRYLRILRKAGGTWLSSDWEKIYAGYADSAGDADTVDSQHFTYSNTDNNPTYLWGTNSNGSSILAHRASMSVNYANSAGSATYCLRFSQEKSTYNANEVSTGIIDNYGSSSYWVNAPGGMSYGSIISLASPSYGNALGMQLAWDTNHNDSTGTRYLWFRTGNNLGWSSNWKRIATDSDLNSYLPLSGGTMTGNINWNTDSHGIYFFGNCGIEKWAGYGPSLVAETGYQFEISSKDNRASRVMIVHTGGGLTIGGNLSAANFYATSDRSKKQNISSFSEHIRKFQLKDTEKWHYGVIALEVPKLFVDGEEGNMTVNYNSMLSYYIGLLENRVAQLESELKALKEKLGGSGS